MSSGSVDVRKVGVGGIEDEGEISSGQDDSVEMLALDEGVREIAELLEVFLGGTRLFDDASVDAGDGVDFGGRGWDDFCRVQPAEHAGFDGDASSEEGNATEAATRSLCCNGIQKADERQRGEGSEFRGADLRGKRWDGRHFSASAGELMEQAGKVFGQHGGVASRSPRYNVTHIGVDHEQARRQPARSVRIDHGLVIEDPSAHSETGDKAEGAGWWCRLHDYYFIFERRMGCVERLERLEDLSLREM